MKKFWIKKSLLFLLCFVAFAMLLGWVVMALWNAILPAIIGVKEISFIQATGILLLSKILFGGFNGGFGNRRKEDFKIKLKEKFGNMSQEDKDTFNAAWKNRCSNGWRKKEQEPNESMQ